MTAYVLVAGPFTDGRLWEETAARLRERGAGAHPVTFTDRPAAGHRDGTGRGGPGHDGTGRDGIGHDGTGRGGPDPGSPAPDGAGANGPGPDGAGQDGPGPDGADLDAHVEQLVRIVERLPEPVVLVGHGYGLYPVLGAADRVPERVARIVSVDTAVPRDGDAALALVPDADLRDRLVRGGAVPPPRGEAWLRWGSTEGVPGDAARLLDRLAVPQPAATLTRPLRLTGAADAVPLTGILCTGNGASLAMVRMLVESGPPQFRSLTDDRYRFLELATGHWPMLADPDALAEVLLAAGAGEGERVSAPEGQEQLPTHLLPFLLDPPERPRERSGRVDLHLPAADEDGSAADPAPAATERPRPAVVFVHGGPVAPDQRPTPRETPFFLGYARCAAGRGLVGVTLDHRLHALTDYARAADDLAAAVARVRANPRVDPDRIALWFFSTGSLLAADWLAAPPSWLRCVALTYPLLAPVPGWEAVEPRFRPVDALGRAADAPPVVLTRAGLENPAFDATVRDFLVAAAAHGTDVEVVDVPHGRHGFELLDPTDESREAVTRAMDTVAARLHA
ncbi:alpha/beta hydrolase [Streptomyces sp. NPDC003327]